MSVYSPQSSPHPRDWQVATDAEWLQELAGLERATTGCSQLLNLATREVFPRLISPASRPPSIEPDCALTQHWAESLVGLPLEPGLLNEEESCDWLLRWIKEHRSGRSELRVVTTVSAAWRDRLRRRARLHGLRVAPVEEQGGIVDAARLLSVLSDRTAAVIVAQPNVFGLLEDLSEIGQVAHARGALLVTLVDAWAQLGLRPASDYCVNAALLDWHSLGFRWSGASTRHWSTFVAPHLRGIETSTSRVHAPLPRALGEMLQWWGSDRQLRQLTLASQAARYLAESLAQVTGVRWVSGCGMLDQILIEVERDAQRLREELLEQGVAFGIPMAAEGGQRPNRLRLTVPADLDASEVDYLLRALHSALRQAAS